MRSPLFIVPLYVVYAIMNFVVSIFFRFEWQGTRSTLEIVGVAVAYIVFALISLRYEIMKKIFAICIFIFSLLNFALQVWSITDLPLLRVLQSTIQVFFILYSIKLYRYRLPPRNSPSHIER